MAFGRCRIVPDLRVIPLDQGDAVRREVASNGAEQGQPRILGRVDERAHKQHATECAPEIQILDARQDRFGALNEVEHLRIEVDRHNSAAESNERMSDATGAAPELENFGVPGDLTVDQLRLAGGLEQAVQVDGRAWIAHAGESGCGTDADRQPAMRTWSYH